MLTTDAHLESALAGATPLGAHAHQGADTIDIKADEGVFLEYRHLGIGVGLQEASIITQSSDVAVVTWSSLGLTCELH